MCKNMRILNKTPKTHNARHGKGGFTLVELCVVLALLAILAVGITSFSVLMNGFAADASEETAFWEENAALKSELRRWIAENDVAGKHFFVEGGVLKSAPTGQTENANTLYLAGSALMVNGVQKAEYSAIDGIEFSSGSGFSVIKCTVYYITEDGARKEIDFLFSCRAATVDFSTGGGANG